MHQVNIGTVKFEELPKLQLKVVPRGTFTKLLENWKHILHLPPPSFGGGCTEFLTFIVNCVEVCDVNKALILT